MRPIQAVLCLGALALASGCSSIAKGVTEAVLEQSASEDKRQCHIDGPAWDGLETALKKQEADRAMNQSYRQLKVVMVHGIGRHLPGYSARLTEKLMHELNLDVRSENAKEIILSDPDIGDGPTALLRVWRYTNKAATRELLFYELTWSPIAEEAKKPIDYDDSVEQSYRRTAINNLAKGFFNARVPDALIYLGATRRPILASVRQATCWATSADWNELPDSGKHECNLLDPKRLKYLKDDDYAFLSHSIGSRVVIDTLQQQAEFAVSQTTQTAAQFREISGNKQYPVFMLANQLPLLQLGQPIPKVHGQIADYCRPGGQFYANRLMGGLNIKAFSDPNDLLSYGIPPKFADDYLDSRMCPTITNITLNVSNPVSLAGIDVVNPGEAHSGYDYDDRVIAIIARGVGGPDEAQLIKDKCTWMHTVPSR